MPAEKDEHLDERSELSVSNADVTIGFDPGALDPTTQTTASGNRSAVVSKQNRDLAFASSLLRSGIVTKRRLANVIARWTAHGHETLADYLLQKGVITKRQKSDLEAQGNRWLEHLASEVDEDESNRSMGRQNRTIVSRLDASGKLSKLLGIADTSILCPDEMESRVVGARYTLLRRLGRGGIGTVWLARDENLRRYVAVKEVSYQGDDDDSAMVHFRREAEITGLLEHPGIVSVHQFGTDEATGRPFYVMRFVGKRTLQDAIAEYHELRAADNEDKMAMHRLLAAFVNVCHAIAHAHSRKIIHRDLKPENIAIDSFGQTVVLDWGLAKINDETGMYDANGQAERGDLHSVQSSHAGRVLGTPSCMAPEQAAGRLEEMDELTDVYGLGGILYAILTGQTPHEGIIESEVGTLTTTKLLSKIVAAEVVPATELDDEVAPELSAICSKALSNKRYLRYSSATELAEEVERYRAGSPVAAYSAPLKQRATRWMATHPTLTQMILLLVTLTVLGVAAIGYTARKGQTALQEARYASLKEFARDLELNLQFESQELIQDIRFITEFPLMRVITATQTGASPSSVDIDGITQISLAEATPEEWLQRHGQLLDGILNANPSYLLATTVRFEEPKMNELIRTERLRAGTRPRRLPKGRLYSREHSESDGGFADLRPGQVLLTTGDRLADNVPTNNRSPLVLAAICPVFDETGAFFGINAIEFDVRPHLEELLVAVSHDNVEVFITSAKGQIALHYRDGQPIRKYHDKSVVDLIPDLAKVYPASELGSDEASDEFGDGRSMFATRIRIGNLASSAVYGIVTRTTRSD